MRTSEHLQSSNITAFREGILSRRDHDEAVQHLLQCGSCRKLLPFPNPAEFWDCVFVERHPDTSECSDTYFGSLISWVQSFARAGLVISTKRSTVFASLLFFLIAGFIMLLLFSPVSHVNNTTVELVIDDSGRPTNHDLSFGQFTQPEEKTNAESKPAPNVASNPKRKQSTTAILQQKDNYKTRGQLFPGKNKRPERGETRGSGFPCGGYEAIFLEATESESTVRLRWNKVEGAVMYRVFVSDLDEKLIDQYETTDRTAYTVAAGLNRDTVYRWKLIVTLKDGKRIVGESQNFQLGKLSKSRSQPEDIAIRKKGTALVRCLENK